MGNNKNNMNKWIQNKIRNPLKNLHFLPQYHYIFNSKGGKVVNHVLQFEKLDEEFPILMKLYSLDVSLGTKNARKNSQLTSQNLTRKTLDLLNIYYAEDFEFFDYEIL